MSNDVLARIRRRRSDHLTSAPPPTRRTLKANVGPADRAFRGIASGGGALVLVIMVLVGTFLAYRAAQALEQAGFSFLTTQAWEPDGGTLRHRRDHRRHGPDRAGRDRRRGAARAWARRCTSPSTRPARIRRTLIALVDLMAAVPSIVYGLWGFFFLQWHVVGLSRWISDWFGWIPIFDVDGVGRNDPLSSATVYTSSTFIAGIVVALMVTPIACSIMREVFSQAPPGEREGAFALGATRWGMIRSVVLPFGKGGIIGGTMLGLGRALGETIAVFLIISPVFEIQPHILENGTNSVSSLIALRYGEASPFGISALMAAGLALFALTLVVNFAASTVVARSRSGAVSDA